MQFAAVLWYHGESNVGSARYYACALPSLIMRWRQALGQARLWWGVVQIAGFRYSEVVPGTNQPEVAVSRAVGDLRQAQLRALTLPRVGIVSAVDTGEWTDIHPRDKHTLALRLADQFLWAEAMDGRGSGEGSRDGGGKGGGDGGSEGGGDGTAIATSGDGTDVPLYAGVSALSQVDDVIRVTIAVRSASGGRRVPLTDRLPPSTLASSTDRETGPMQEQQQQPQRSRGAHPSSQQLTPNKCVDSVSHGAGFGPAFPEDCGYPMIIGRTADGSSATLNASAAVGGSDASSVILTARGVPSGFSLEATSYGRASWPMPLFFSRAGGLPLVPWHANLSTANAHTPPPSSWHQHGARELEVRMAARLRICWWVTADWHSRAVATACAAAMARECTRSSTRRDSGRTALGAWCSRQRP